MKLINSSITSPFDLTSSKVQEINWNKKYSSPLTIVESKQSYYPDFPDIKELGKKLASFVGVESVRAIVPDASNRCWIEFEILLQPSNAELPYETWDKIQDLVIDYEWNLRDKSGEKWYFGVDCVEYFSKICPESFKIFNSSVEPSEAFQKIWSSPNANFVAI
ncbi:hypothetical protein APA_1302 [Pseudanabaena sp. lw0831]|uniref:hypothetical protein n=1 Tax=Pseudanabaena sp. lw0831 TaxID=1357935 RepID=UPI001914FF7C|nr:hypothetical protein [Pseudanabaena sp. lw0831]GBO53395.1 hypothetical protein APA_1302 [Pseudanabaena sp. lw0831]